MASTTTLFVGHSLLHDADRQISGGFPESYAEDGFSDSESECELELNSAAAELYKLGDGIWVHEKYLAYLKKPKDLDIILYQLGKPGDKDHQWMAQAPEWPDALGFGSSREEASEDLQSELAAAKLIFIKDGDVVGIEQIPVRPCKKNAEKALRNRWRATYYEELEKESIDSVWSKISV